MFSWRGNGNVIETYGNGKEWESCEPFQHTSIVNQLITSEFKTSIP